MINERMEFIKLNLFNQDPRQNVFWHFQDINGPHIQDDRVDKDKKNCEMK